MHYFVCGHSSFAIILKRKRKLLALLLLSYRCYVTINGLCLSLMVPWVSLQYVIVVFPDHTHFFHLGLHSLHSTFSVSHPLVCSLV